jgi:hypothetical protein
MRGRKPDGLILEPSDGPLLQQLLRDRNISQRVATRARILLTRAKHQRVRQVATLVDQKPSTIWRVCERYRHQGIEAALYDAKRSGRRPVFSPTGAATN